MFPILVLTSLALHAASATQPATRPGAPAGDLRVMTFNIRYGTANDGPDRWTQRRGLVFDVLRRHRPDVLGLQEALRFQLDEIRAAVPGYAEIGVGRNDGQEGGEYTAILYRQDRLRLVESGTFWLSDTPEVPGSKTWGNSLPRICTWGRFEDRTTGGAFYVYNTHLDHQSQPSRERSVELLARRVAGRAAADAPVIITGDFNAAERNPAVRYLLGEAKGAATRLAADQRIRFMDTFRALHPQAKEFGTFNDFKGTAAGDKIDYILTLPGVKILEAEMLHDHSDGRYPSDHFPVFALLRLR